MNSVASNLDSFNNLCLAGTSIPPIVFAMVYTVDIILRAGTSIYASSGFGAGAIK
jgi:hypothetical protein